MPHSSKRPGFLLAAAASLGFVMARCYAPLPMSAALYGLLVLGCAAVLLAMLAALFLGGRPLPALPFNPR